MSISTNLIHLNPSRPAVIEKDNGLVYISVHDEYYRTNLREWKNKLKLVHPDLTGETAIRKTLVQRKNTQPYILRTKRGTSNSSHRRYKTIVYWLRKFEAWKEREVKWYEQYGLTPPEWGG